MKRPALSSNPRDGVLRTEHFQMAYATNDIARARQLFEERYGIREFRRLEGPLRQGGSIHIELAWVGTIMYELLTAVGPGSSIYVDKLPTTQFAIRHHHLGYLIHDETEWNALFTEVARQGLNMPHVSHTEGFMRSCFVEAPELGHYFEYLFPEPAGLAFFESVPSS
jgi:hypothetical protein